MPENLSTSDYQINSSKKRKFTETQLDTSLSMLHIERIEKLKVSEPVTTLTEQKFQVSQGKIYSF